MHRNKEATSPFLRVIPLECIIQKEHFASDNALMLSWTALLWNHNHPTCNRAQLHPTNERRAESLRPASGAQGPAGESGGERQSRPGEQGKSGSAARPGEKGKTREQAVPSGAPCDAASRHAAQALTEVGTENL